jgi:hypothetical protein
MWEYDYGLRRCGSCREWTWPKSNGTEAAMVHKLKAGKLAPCRFNGLVPIASELDEIEERWRSMIRNPQSGEPGEVPAWFHRRHAPRILAE